VPRQQKPTNWRAAISRVDSYTVIPEGVGGATEKDVLEDPTTGVRYIAKLGGRNSDLEVMTPRTEPKSPVAKRSTARPSRRGSQPRGALDVCPK
jgi:hypothetical protein